MIQQAKFSIGQIVQHKLFGYRGVVYEADSAFSLSDDWYEQVAKSRPPKDAPWYHVLVDGSGQTTYVAERNLEAAADTSEITHPLLDEFFRSYDQGQYRARQDTMQ